MICLSLHELARIGLFVQKKNKYVRLKNTFTCFAFFDSNIPCNLGDGDGDGDVDVSLKPIYKSLRPN